MTNNQSVLSVEEGNKIIAKFDGKQKIHPNDLKYHSSWDWLIPVYEKIARVWHGLNNKQIGQVKTIIDALQNRLVLAEISGVHEFCIHFIQWFNKNSEK
jgi:hypothetical protein